MAHPVRAIPEGYHSISPSLTCSDAARAIEFYKDVFGAVEIMRMPSPDGKISHAELKIGDSIIFLNDEMGPGAASAPGTPRMSLFLYVENADKVFTRAVAAGAQDYLVKGRVEPEMLRRALLYAIERKRAELIAADLHASELRARENALLERGLLRMDPERHTCTWKNEPVTLTVTEFLILQALASRPGVVKSRNALMDAAYDDQVYVDDRTIDSHIKRLRKKFKNVDTDFAQIETLYGVGYRYRDR